MFSFQEFSLIIINSMVWNLSYFFHFWIVALKAHQAKLLCGYRQFCFWFWPFCLEFCFHNGLFELMVPSLLFAKSKFTNFLTSRYYMGLALILFGVPTWHHLLTHCQLYYYYICEKHLKQSPLIPFDWCQFLIDWCQ